MVHGDYCVNASVEDHGSLQQLGSAAAQLGVPAPEPAQQSRVHRLPIHLNWHVELHQRSHHSHE